ncbi:MAG: MFS transporter [Desulfosarcina sp.]|nr:MFS transporter [Desulfobacterales bacterium]
MKPSVPISTKEKRTTLFVMTLTSFMGPFMVSSVNIALPDIQKEFSVHAVLLSWIATSYLLAIAAALVPAGRIADIHGRRRLFVTGLGILTLASACAATSFSVEMLIATRVLQGFGAAMVVTTGMPILISVFPLEERGRVIGTYVAAVYIGLSVGPPVGGLLTDLLNWRWIFIVVIPLNLTALYLTRRHLKREWVDAPGEKLDWVGSILYALSLVLIVYGASRLPQMQALVMVATGAFGLLAFGLWELRVPNPVFEIRLFFSNRVFAFSSLAALIHYGATFAVTFLLSLYLQYIQGLPPRNAGMVLMIQPVIMALISPLAGRLSDRLEPRWIATAGMTLTAAGLGILAFAIDTGPSLVLIVGLLGLLGLGFALFSSPNMNAIMSSIDKRYYGIASGAVATMRLLGQMASMAVATVLFAICIGPTEIRPQVYPAFIRSIEICLAVFTVLCLLGIIFSAYRGRLRPHRGPAAGPGR